MRRAGFYGRNMNLYAKLLLVFAAAAALLSFYFFQRPKQTSLLKLPEEKTMELSSSVFANNGPIPQRFTCDGENINPPLQITQVAEGARTLVLLVDDPDAPMGVWDHWVVWNIDPQTETVAENSLPTDAVQGTNSSNSRKYIGPCPPSGIHHYHFKLYALDTDLNLDPSSRKADVESAMEGHVMDWTELIGTYQHR
jgi:Raf kinase inhibitor-like YbhB/YbcL family protein